MNKDNMKKVLISELSEGDRFYFRLHEFSRLHRVTRFDIEKSLVYVERKVDFTADEFIPTGTCSIRKQVYIQDGNKD